MKELKKKLNSSSSDPESKLNEIQTEISGVLVEGTEMGVMTTPAAELLPLALTLSPLQGELEIGEFKVTFGGLKKHLRKMIHDKIDAAKEQVIMSL